MRLGKWFLRDTEIPLSVELEVRHPGHAHDCTSVGHLSSATDLARARHFLGYYRSVALHQGIRHEERISPRLVKFVLREVCCVSTVDDLIKEGWVDLFREDEGTSYACVGDPVLQRAAGTRDLIMNLERHFGMTRESLLCQPVPELGMRSIG